MDIRTGMKMVKELKREGYSLQFLATGIYEAHIKFNKGQKITNMERFILGLKWSKYLAIEPTPTAYEAAEVKKQEYLKQLGIIERDLSTECYKKYNLT